MKRQMFDVIRTEYKRYGRSTLEGGFWVAVTYRYGAWSLTQKFRPWRMLNSAVYFVMHFLTSTVTKVYLERTTEVGADLHLIHATMIQIHPGVRIGERCGIMHNVTIGSNLYKYEVPVVGNDVFIGCGASILGDVKIGDEARIAANSLVISDVPPGAVAMGVPAKIIPSMQQLRSVKVAGRSDLTSVANDKKYAATGKIA